MHRRAFADISVRDVEIVMQLETRGREHVAAIMALLDQHGVVVRQDIQDVETEPRGTSDDNRDCESERQ